MQEDTIKLQRRHLFNTFFSSSHQTGIRKTRWGFPMSYHKEDDDEMIQSMVDCGGMTKEMAKDKVRRRREGRKEGWAREDENNGGKVSLRNEKAEEIFDRSSHPTPPFLPYTAADLVSAGRDQDGPPLHGQVRVRRIRRQSGDAFVGDWWGGRPSFSS